MDKSKIVDIMMNNLGQRKVLNVPLQTVRNDLLEDLEHVQEAVEWLVLATPTGPVREKLTEVNIHLMAAQMALKDLEQAAKYKAGFPHG